MKKYKGANSRTWETVLSPHQLKAATPNFMVGKSIAKRFDLDTAVGMWLVDQAIESLTEHPFHTENTNVAQEAIFIGTLMGFITDEDVVEEVHRICEKRPTWS